MSEKLCKNCGHKGLRITFEPSPSHMLPDVQETVAVCRKYAPTHGWTTVDPEQDYCGEFNRILRGHARPPGKDYLEAEAPVRPEPPEPEFIKEGQVPKRIVGRKIT
jgi:hypothetical protein